MAEEIRLNRQNSLHFTSKLKQMQGYVREEEDSWTSAQYLAGSLNYANMAPSIRDGLRGASDALKRLEAFLEGFREHEQAVEEFDRESARLLNSIQYTGSEDVALNGWADEQVEIDPSLMNSILWGGAGPNMHIRSLFESQGYTVDWASGATAHTSTITLTSPNGEQQTLQEGVDYYIKDDNAYFYNNVRSILEASGAKVDYNPIPGGGSSITVTMPIVSPFSTGGVAVTTLVEGKDYTIGADGKAHFVGDAHGPLPPGAVAAPTPAPTPTPTPASTPTSAPQPAPAPTPQPAPVLPAQAPADSVAAKYYESGEYLGLKVKIESWFKQTTNMNCSATAAAIVQQVSGNSKYTIEYIMKNAWVVEDGVVKGIIWGDAGMAYSNPASEEAALEKVLTELVVGRMSAYKVNGTDDSHWVAVCGYQVCEDSTGPYDLRNFIIIDPADGTQMRLGDKYVTYNRGNGKPAIVTIKQE